MADFGPLPIQIPAEGLEKWWGKKSFFLHHDRLEFQDKSGITAVPFDSIERIEANRNSLFFFFKEPGKEKIGIKYSNDPNKLADLIRQLIAEGKKWKEISTFSLSSNEGREAFLEVLNWRGQPFVAGIDLLIGTAIIEGASDLHFEPGPSDVRLTIRVRQELLEICKYPIKFHTGLMARLKYLSGCQSHLSGVPQEGAWTISGRRGVEARLSIFPSLHGDRCSLRIIRPIEHSNIASLGWTEEAARAWVNLILSGLPSKDGGVPPNRPDGDVLGGPGLFLITGPVGSGKTTALYASLAEFSRPSEGRPRRVATLEDPVEGRVLGICQASLDPKSGLGLAEAFKYLLRQDPDVLALGEIRDVATLKEALQGGLAGHLVLATFHSADAPGAMNRIQQMGLEPYLITNSLRGILSLTLSRAVCDCQEMNNCTKCLGSGKMLKPTAKVFAVTPQNEVVEGILKRMDDQ